MHVCVVLEGGLVERDGPSWRDVGAGTVRVSGAARHAMAACRRALTVDPQYPASRQALERLGVGALP